MDWPYNIDMYSNVMSTNAFWYEMWDIEVFYAEDSFMRLQFPASHLNKILDQLSFILQWCMFNNQAYRQESAEAIKFTRKVTVTGKLQALPGIELKGGA